MKLKKLLSLALALTMALTLFGCSRPSENGGEEAAEGGSDGETWTFTIAHTDTEARSVHVAAEEFAEYMAEQTDGRFEVRIAPNGELGDDEELLKALNLGTVNMYVGYNGIPAGLLGSNLAMFEMPFLFDDGDHMLRTFANGGLDLYNKQLEGTGYYCVAMGYEGARQMLTTEKPVETIEDMHGLRMRCGNVQGYIDYYEAVGAAPTTVQFGEVYTSLSQGVIEGVDHVVAILEDQKFTEVCNYAIMDYHIISPLTYMISDSFLDTLPDDIREIFLEGVQAMADKVTEIDGGYERDLPAQWEENGMTVIYPTDEVRAEFREAAQPVYDAYEAEFPELAAEAWALVEENREG